MAVPPADFLHHPSQTKFNAMRSLSAQALQALEVRGASNQPACCCFWAGDCVYVPYAAPAVMAHLRQQAACTLHVTSIIHPSAGMWYTLLQH